MASMPYLICMISHRAVGELHEQRHQQGRLPRLRSMLTWSMSSRGPPDALYGYLPVAASSRVRPRLLHHPKATPFQHLLSPFMVTRTHGAQARKLSCIAGRNNMPS